MQLILFNILLLLLLLGIATLAHERHDEKITVSHNIKEEEFHEELYIKPLPSGHVNTYFQFTTRWHYGKSNDLHDTHLVPRPMAELLLHFDINEFHVSLTQGLWRYESWGYPVIDNAPGAEVWAWFSAPNLTQKDVDQQWLRLMGTFSGIICASLNFIDSTNSLEPKYGFRPRFGAEKINNIPKFLRYATLPREIVCTENLTPWKKLLPCNSKNGFASLLNSGYVHNTNYHSLNIAMRTICERSSDNKNCILELTETANLVYDTKILGSNDFSLRRMFGQGLNGHCVLAKSSKIYVSLEDDDETYELTPPPTERLSHRRGNNSQTATTIYGVYDMQREPLNRLFNIAWVKRKQDHPLVPKPPIYAHRYILGHGQERGLLVTQIINTHTAPLPVLFQENIPWYVPIYLHTLTVRIVSPVSSQLKDIQPKIIHYRPGVQRLRPYHLELAFELPPQSTVQIAIDFDYIFLKWLEYPPDANHGHYLGSAVITTQIPLAHVYRAVPINGYLFAHSFNASATDGSVIQLRTETLILSLPTPDFSMPYNVICLACTVVALAFGPIHSVATKKIVIEAKDEAPQTIFGKLKQKFFNKKKPMEKKEEQILDEHLVMTAINDVLRERLD